jgi:hypothetical protein
MISLSSRVSKSEASHTGRRGSSKLIVSLVMVYVLWKGAERLVARHSHFDVSPS